MRRRAIAVVLVGLWSAACSGFFHQPRPDRELPLAKRAALVRCNWVRASGAEPGTSPKVAQGWVWAHDAEGRRLELGGRLEDGIFAVTAVEAVPKEAGRDRARLEPTAETLARACEETLRGEKAATGAELVSVRGARVRENVGVPLVFPAAPTHPRPVSRVVVVGDSLSDTGNLHRRLRVFPSKPYWQGRFSNGPTWADHLEGRTGLAVLNLAYGGAVATKHREVPHEQLVSVVTQGGQHFVSGSLDRQVVDYLERDLAGAPMQRPEETVFVIWGGANDYIVKEPFSGEVQTLLDSPAGEAGYERIAAEAVSALARQVRELHAAGGRHFAIVNLPNLGFTPMVVHNQSYHRARDDAASGRPNAARLLELSSKLGSLSRHHNQRLAAAVRELLRELAGVHIVLVNAADAMGRMLDRRAPTGEASFDYGFALDALAVELEADGRRLRLQDRCYSGGYLGSKNPAHVCEHSGHAVFWDTVHPSSLTHCWVAYFLQDAFARGGWAPAPSLAEHRDYCLAGADPPRGE